MHDLQNHQDALFSKDVSGYGSMHWQQLFTDLKAFSYSERAR
jgi:hypothetical protein